MGFQRNVHENRNGAKTHPLRILTEAIPNGPLRQVILTPSLVNDTHQCCPPMTPRSLTRDPGSQDWRILRTWWSCHCRERVPVLPDSVVTQESLAGRNSVLTNLMSVFQNYFCLHWKDAGSRFDLVWHSTHLRTLMTAPQEVWVNCLVLSGSSEPKEGRLSW